MTQDESVLKKMESSGAFLKGHFELSSGLHSDQYFQCALFLRYPEKAEHAGNELAKKVKSLNPSCVVGLALGAIPLAHEVARSLGLEMIFVERKQDKMQLRRGFSVEKGQRVLVVEDVITTGGSVKETIKLLKELGAEIVGVASLIDRSESGVDFGYPLLSLLRMPAQTFDPSNCSLCKKGVPVDKPGSKPAKST